MAAGTRARSHREGVEVGVVHVLRWPIATGIIEGACRHIAKDRMDPTGARWGLTGAEAVLKLRAIKANSDFNDYWHYHLNQERQHPPGLLP